MDPFEPLGGGLKDTVATLKGDYDAEFHTTESCAETGCGGGPGDLW
ncbi:MAG TPA: hypothetical protein VNZ52_08130 [Candidatus Thermoplasmatota archaeon]|nr:hypothetical protein [Candidatus Thermoplasmatota archaeon]